MSPRFALFGAAAAVADRHVRAIAQHGGELVACADPRGSSATIDEHFPAARCFDSVEALVDACRGEIDYAVVCTPNDLHEAHVAQGLELGAHVICEKPVALSSEGVDRLLALEREAQGTVHAVLQLRLHPEIRRMAVEATGEAPHRIELDYVLARGADFLESWHGREERSGGLIFEIGIHFLDLLLALFGAAEEVVVHRRDALGVRGELALERARVRWRLSIDPADIPSSLRGGTNPSHRLLRVDGQDYDLARGRGTVGLHTQLYEQVLAGAGYGLEDARPAIVLADRIRRATPIPSEAIR